MVLGSELAMPIIVLNMGGEMIYILHQRLQAQQVPEEKSRKVLEGKNILFYDYFFYHIYDLEYFSLVFRRRANHVHSNVFG